MSKKLFFNNEAREKLQKGINMVADAAGSTLGARGKTVIISSGYGHMPITTKDGVTVVKSTFLDDEIENTGVMLIRGVAEKQLETCGDGTTTGAVLAQSILNNGMDAIFSPKQSWLERFAGIKSRKVNSQEVKSGIDKAVNCVVETLKQNAIQVDNNDMIKNVATISANNDPEIGGLIAEAYSKIGNDGLLTIEDSKTIETYVKTVEGAEMARGYGMSDKFVTDPKKMEIVYENPRILVLDYEVKTLKEIEPIMKEIAATPESFSRPFIIIAQGFEGEVFNTFVVNKLQNGMKLCLIQAPAKYQKEAFRDVACLVGAKLISDEHGLKPEHSRVDHTGTCEKIIVSKTSTLFIGGNTNKEELEQIQKEIKLHIHNETNPLMLEVLGKRLARLSGSIGVIYVGGATDVETKERKDRVDDAVRAVKSAIEEGVVAGGGVSLIRCIKELASIEANGDEKIGVELIAKACMAPLQKMLSNAGLEQSIANQVLEGNWGYNVKTMAFEDLFKVGIIDPVKVVRCAMQNAASVSSQVLGSDVLMVEMKPTV